MSVLDVILMILTGFIAFLPAMVPNSAAAILGGGTPMDFGRSWRGKRILGDGKTWKGFFGGGFSGVFLGLLIMGISYIFDPSGMWIYGSFWNGLAICICLSFGSLCGDLGGAFIKRRLGMKRGEKAPILDQYDFVIGAFLVTAIFCWGWLFANYFDGWHISAFIFIMLTIFIIHRGTNIIGYKMGIKKEPW